MKYLLILFLLVSCNNVTIPKSEYDSLRGKPGPLIIDNEQWELSVGTDGHDYIDNGRYDSYVCMHYVDCRLCASRKDKIIKVDRNFYGETWTRDSIIKKY